MEKTDSLDNRPLNLNSAPREKVLAELWMIGAKRARALILHRPYRSWDEIEQIPGFDWHIAHRCRRGALISASLRGTGRGSSGADIR